MSRYSKFKFGMQKRALNSPEEMKELVKIVGRVTSVVRENINKRLKNFGAKLPKIYDSHFSDLAQDINFTLSNKKLSSSQKKEEARKIIEENITQCVEEMNRTLDLSIQSMNNEFNKFKDIV